MEKHEAGSGVEGTGKKWSQWTKNKTKKQPACILVITHIQIKGNIFTQTGSYLHIYIQQTETFTETLIHHGAMPNIGFYYIYIFLYIS